MKSFRLGMLAVLMFTAAACQHADHEGHRAHTVAQNPSPYAGQEQRVIKSLPLQQVEGYLAGRGLGYAKPAELNGYPGPKHVLELADSLALTPAQREATQARFDAMQVEAQRQGRAFLAAEAALDSLFAYSAATAESVRRLTEEAAAIEAQLRLSHLDAHMAMMDVLTPEQIADYSRLRGYTRGDMAGHHGGGGHHGHP